MQSSLWGDLAAGSKKDIRVQSFKQVFVHAITATSTDNKAMLNAIIAHDTSL
jgi:hypothetical protein